MADPVGKVFKSKFYAQQATVWMRKCKSYDCPMREAFAHLLTLYEENEKLERQLKFEEDYPYEK